MDWPLAIELVLVFVVMSFLRYRFFKRRMDLLKKREQAALNEETMKKAGTP